MPFHVLGYYTAALASAASNVALGNVVDQMVYSSNSQFQMPKRVTCIGAYGSNDAYTSLRINAPSLRRLFYPQVDPVDATLAPSNRPPINWYGDMGPQFDYTEGVSVEGSRGVVAASAAAALLWIADSGLRQVGGPIFSWLVTSAITIAAGTWASGSLTYTQTLPAGRYQIVGMSSYGANLYAARIVFLMGGFRPGVLAQQAYGEFSDDMFRRGNAGLFGEFDNTTIPSVECMGVGAGSAQTHVLDLIKVA